MSPYLILGVPLFAVFWNLYWLLLRPERKRRKAALAIPAVPVPEPRVPRDISRPYPREASACGELLDTCPICGMADPGNLDGGLLGWPAHSECAEWLGDWQPKNAPPPPPYRPTGSVTINVSSSPGVQVNVGDRNMQAVQSGMASVNEVRERLNREIIASWGVPPAALEEHTHKVGDPVPGERCPKCGARFYGTPDYLRQAFKMHLQVGCRQSSSSPALPLNSVSAMVLTAYRSPASGYIGRTYPTRVSTAP